MKVSNATGKPGRTLLEQRNIVISHTTNNEPSTMVIGTTTRALVDTQNPTGYAQVVEDLNARLTPLAKHAIKSPCASVFDLA